MIKYVLWRFNHNHVERCFQRFHIPLPSRKKQFCQVIRVRSVTWEMQTLCMKAVTERKRMKKKKKRYLIDVNNARPPDTAKLRWKAIYSVLNPTFGYFCEISRNRDCLFKLCMLVKSAGSVSGELLWALLGKTCLHGAYFIWLLVNRAYCDNA